MKFRNIVFGVLGNVAAIVGAQAATVNFADLPTSTTPELFFDGGSVTGSADVQVLNFNGIGIVGGPFDSTVDGNESMAFSFSAPVNNVSYSVQFAGNSDGDGTVGDRSIEIFGLGGTSLGVFAQFHIGTFALSDLVGAAIITGFELTAEVDSFRISSISFDLAPSEVPIPAALPLFLAGLAGVGAIGRKRKQSV
ncbi:VPLPA-CTERM sorting domain-containing protein [Hyphococcus lacteus]|uniref:VPLPA-CTERM sorting domain-containing protein n=1 Tax=Hyphococcus lacteus TaxID=3143536 RepID=A0ABV3Z482_9PROT